MTPATAIAARPLPLPACEPPYDGAAGLPATGRTDRRGPSFESGVESSAVVQGTLALAFLLPNGVPAVPESPLELVPPPDLHLVPDADAVLDEAEFGPQPTPRAALPEPRTWAGRFVQAVIEVLAGDRPASQLVRWTTTEVYDDVACRITSGARPGSPTPARAVVRSVHVAEPADGVAEVSALVRHGIRCTAV